MGRGREAIWAVGLAGIAVALFWGYGPLDDDYISYRYAANWLGEGQLAYNTDQFVEGFTTPLWLFLITGAMGLGLAPELASQFLGIAALIGCVMLLAKLWQNPARQGFAWPALVLACVPAMAFHALGGLGTLPLAFLILAWAQSWKAARSAEREPRMAALWLGLACLMRAECLLIVPFFLWTERRQGAKVRGWVQCVLLALLPVAMWCVFRWYYYGELLPNTYYAKRLGFDQELGYGLRYLWESTLNSGVGLWLLLLLPLAFVARGSDLRRCFARVVLAHALYVVLVGGDYIDMARFFVPMLPLMIYLAAESLEMLLGARPKLHAASGLACMALVLWPFAQLSHKKEVYTLNEGRWKQVGAQLKQSFPAQTSVVLSPIGCVGYLSGLLIVDPLGLTNKAMRDVLPDPAVTLKGHQRHDADWVFAQRPAIYIPSNARLMPNTPFFSLMWELDLIQHSSLASNYRLAEMPVQGSYPLVFYLRGDLELPAGGKALSAR